MHIIVELYSVMDSVHYSIRDLSRPVEDRFVAAGTTSGYDAPTDLEEWLHVLYGVSNHLFDELLPPVRQS
jgi:hypothetical protein